MCSKFGSPEETLTTLIDTFREHDKVLKERNKFESELEHEKEAFRELEQETLMEKANNDQKLLEGKSNMVNVSPDSIRVLSEALAASKEMLDFYARENKRLLEKVNHSEYDEKIIGLKDEIDKAKKSADSYKTDRDKHFIALTNAEKLITELRQSIKSLGREKDELEQVKESNEKTISELKQTISQNNTVISAQNSELERFKHLDLKTAPETPEASDQPN